MVEYTAFGVQQSHLIPLPSLHGGKGCPFPNLVPPDYTVDSESIVGIKLSDSGVVIGYQVDVFTCT